MIYNIIDFETVLEHNPNHFLARAALTEVTHFIASSAHLGSHDLGPNPIDEMVKTVDFGFPHYDGDALEIASVSDSSDCNHVGNGVQCRFYNRDGCGRGSGCVFSHAPDEKSVRDELWVFAFGITLRAFVLIELLSFFFFFFFFFFWQWEERVHLFLARSMQIRRRQMHLLSFQSGPP